MHHQSPIGLSSPRQKIEGLDAQSLHARHRYHTESVMRHWQTQHMVRPPERT
jgi:hypothetical protein